MTRPVLARLAACLVTGLIAVALPALVAPATAAEDDTPLEVSIGSLSPSVIPDKGEITVTGEVTNRSGDTWTDLKVYMLTSAEPMTTADELESAAATDPASEIGDRLYRHGLYDQVGDLAPGASTGFTLSVARRDLQITGAPGAYWLGVHVLGALGGSRDGVADGRARTFVPLMRPRDPSTSLSLVVPVRATVKRETDGSLTNLDAWHDLLATEGRLGRLLELSDTALDVPLTWVVDPAVLDAVRTVAADNAPMDAGPTDTDEQPDAPPSENSSPSPAPTDESTDGSSGEDGTPEVSEEARGAERWLETFRRQADEHTVLSVPYGDVDAAAMLRGDYAKVYDRAVELSAATMENFGVGSTPVLAPPTGFLPRPALPKVDPDTPVILRDAAAPDAPGPVVRSRDGHRIVLTDTSAGAGGPGPTPAFGALAMRQRILSEAAVHALTGPRDEPLVVSTPQTWNPGSDWRIADFFAGLDVPWLRPVDLPTGTADGSDSGYDGQLVYPRREARAELPNANLLATAELSDVGDAYADLLTRNDTVDEFLGKSAMVGSSYRVRNRPDRAATRSRDTTAVIRSRMEQITVEGPSFVTMSSEEGPIGVTIVNGLQEPVTVGIKAIVGDNESDELRIRPAEPVSLGPGQRASVQLRATAKDIGVHSVTLVPTNANGDPLGSSTKFNIRSSQVGMVIWVIMGVGAAVLLIASGARILRRVRERRRTHGPLLKDSTG